MDTTVKMQINTGEIPEMEPQRQFYYMDLAKQLVKEREEAYGTYCKFLQ